MKLGKGLVLPVLALLLAGGVLLARPGLIGATAAPSTTDVPAAAAEPAAAAGSSAAWQETGITRPIPGRATHNYRRYY